MKIRLLVITIFFLSNMNGALGADTDIRLNSLGFLLGMPKKASIIADCSSFSVVWEMLKSCLDRGECASPDSFLLYVMDRKASAKWRLGILWEGKIYFLIFPSRTVSLCQIIT